MADGYPQVLAVTGLSCERDGRALFADLSFSLDKGGLLQVTGGNGSGKSTLLRILMGLFSDYDGDISWEVEMPPLYLGHRHGIKLALTVAENLNWQCRLLGGDASQVAAVVAQLGLAGYEDLPCSQLSEGQRKRVGLGRFLLVHNPCWVMDEPFSAIDAAGMGFLSGCLESHLDAGGAAIFTSHQPVPVDRPVMSVALD